MANALAEETSPYLLQHQHNPVEWLPWSDAAFERAREEDKLVFLSVGYSTCHWCHVMERESFENEAIAAVMNERFVCVKVDREERPDIDATYMNFVQATTGQGGWPMSVWLTPDGEPVVGGTYFPPEDRYGRPGFASVCRQLAEIWREDRGKVEESARKLLGHLQREAKAGAVVRGLPDSRVFGDFVDSCESQFDPEWGGWGGAPKFPRPSVPRLLLQLSERFDGDDAEACREMVRRTARAMAAGGLHDQLGGGFHRYSVDRYWHVPHYEKMLYDQAQLAHLYLDLWQLDRRPGDRLVVEGIFRYVERELRGERGGFLAAEDADSLPDEGSDEKLEGAYWTWRAEEISGLLEARDAAWFCAAYGVEAEGNARPESDPHHELEGRNTLYRAVAPEALAARMDVAPEAIEASLAASRVTLLEARERRPRPHLDDKVVTAWNGLMIGAFARGARVFDDDRLAEVARGAAGFLRERLWEGGRLQRSWRGRAAGVEAFAVDHAFLISGLIDLAGLGEGEWLEWALELQSGMDERFWDEDRAGYVMRASLAGRELLTMRDDYDGAEPAANHVAAENLLKLEALTGEERFGRRAEALLRAGAAAMEKRGFSCPVLLGALDLKLRGVRKFEERGEAPPELAARLRDRYLPRAVFARGEGPGEIVECVGESCRPWRPDQGEIAR